MPMTENAASIVITTYGALRWILPMPPPIWIESEQAAPNARAASASRINQNSALLSCWRSSSRKISENTSGRLFRGGGVVQLPEIHVFQVGRHALESVFRFRVGQHVDQRCAARKPRGQHRHPVAVQRQRVL